MFSYDGQKLAESVLVITLGTMAAASACHPPLAGHGVSKREPPSQSSEEPVVIAGQYGSHQTVEAG